jgi:hypothetical protein
MTLKSQAVPFRSVGRLSQGNGPCLEAEPAQTAVGRAILLKERSVGVAQSVGRRRLSSENYFDRLAKTYYHIPSLGVVGKASG